MEKNHVRKESGVATQVKKELKVGIPLIGSDKNNVIADKVFSYF